MKKANIRHFLNSSILNCLKFNKEVKIASLIIITIGIFLLPKTAFLATITPENIIKLTNKQREAAHLSVLTENNLLNLAAKNKAQAILDNQTFEHTINQRKFSFWIKEAGYEYSIVGENLAIDFATSEGAMKAWLSSEKHRANIFNPAYREIGVAAIEGIFSGQKTIIIAQIFGAPDNHPLIPEEIARRHEILKPWEKNTAAEKPEKTSLLASLKLMRRLQNYF